MDYNILVNKDNPLPRAHIPNTLVDAESEYKKNVYIDKKVKTNSISYLANWAAALRADKHLIVRATSKAEQAVKYILNKK